jgi:ribosomal protein S18 acetylase RimI-like enzyme
MTADTLTFRPAAPDDVEAAVKLIYSSGPGAFDYVFASGKPGRALDFLRYAFLQGGGEFGWRNHVATIAEGRVVGIGAGWDSSTALGFLLAAARQIFGFYGPFAAWGVILRGLRVESAIRPPKTGEFYIGHLGVDPAMRSHGVGARLVAHLLTLAARPRCRNAVLDVAVGNPRAHALYQRLGFVETATRISGLGNRDGRVDDHRRMEQGLGSR